MTASDVEPPQAHLHVYMVPEVWEATKQLFEEAIVHRDHRDVVGGSVQSFDVESLPSSIEAERLLDRHWILYRERDSSSRRDAECSFFDSIAARYELEIDPERNLDNVRTLIGIVDPGRPARVLDFGCGPGLSVRERHGLDLVGCDVCPAMRQQAESHGLTTIGPDDLPSEASAFDGMIASYVLHLEVPGADLQSAVECVRVGGRIAANFHKSRGLSATSENLRAIGQVSELEELGSEHPLHGPIRVWERTR